MNLFESVLLESPRGADNGDKAEERKASDLIQPSNDGLLGDNITLQNKSILLSTLTQPERDGARGKSFNEDLPPIQEDVDSEEEDEMTRRSEVRNIRALSVREVRKIMRTYAMGVGQGEKGEGRIL